MRRLNAIMTASLIGCGGGGSGGGGLEIEIVKQEVTKTVVTDPAYQSTTTKRTIVVEIKQPKSAPKASFAIATPDGDILAEQCMPEAVYKLEVPIEKLPPKAGKIAFQIWGSAACGMPHRKSPTAKPNLAGITVKSIELVVPPELEGGRGGEYTLVGRDCVVRFENGAFAYAKGDATACGTWTLGGAPLEVGPISCKSRKMNQHPVRTVDELPVAISVDGGAPAAAMIHAWDVPGCMHELFGDVATKGVTFEGEPAAPASPKTLVYFKKPTEYDSIGRGKIVAEVDLVVFDKLTTREKLCKYEGGVSETAIAFDHDLVAYDRRTGKEVVKHTITAAPPTCGRTATVTQAGKVVGGGGRSAFVSDKAVDAWLVALLK